MMIVLPVFVLYSVGVSGGLSSALEHHANPTGQIKIDAANMVKTATNQARFVMPDLIRHPVFSLDFGLRRNDACRVFDPIAANAGGLRIQGIQGPSRSRLLRAPGKAGSGVLRRSRRVNKMAAIDSILGMRPRLKRPGRALRMIFLKISNRSLRFAKLFVQR